MQQVPLEHVRDYPRPPRIEEATEHVLVKVGNEVLFDGTGCLKVLETFHPPTYYLPPDQTKRQLLRPTSGHSFCEWKGVASYFDVCSQSRTVPRAVWCYHQPSLAFAAIRGWFALYPGLMDGCWLNDEAVIPQPGGFYGGWISSAVIGPFKGDPNHPELI